MIIPASSPPARNGTSPFNWRESMFNSAGRMMLNAGVATAYQGVLGNCTPPQSYAADGVNLMSDIAQSPAVSDVVASGVQASSLIGPNPGDFTDAPVQTVPLDGSSGYPTPTPIPSQTTTQGIVSPVFPVASFPVRRPQTTCPANAKRVRNRLQLPPAGQAPQWGGAFQTTPGPQGATSFDLLTWIQQNPWGALLIGLGGIAIFSSSSGGNR